MYADFEKGWQDAPLPNTRPEKIMPPDRPPTVVYDMYPGQLTAPFHYRNPVTAAAPFPDTPASTVALLPRPTVSELQRRIAQLEDDAAIERLQNAYGFYVNKRQWDEVAKLFSSQGTLRDRPARRVCRARKHPARAGAGRTCRVDARGFQRSHPVPAGDACRPGRPLGATSRVRELALTGRYGEWAHVGGGTQENDYVKEGGVWKIRSLHLYTRFLADYARGWRTGALPAPAPSATAAAGSPGDGALRGVSDILHSTAASRESGDRAHAGRRAVNAGARRRYFAGPTFMRWVPVSGSANSRFSSQTYSYIL